MTFLVQVYPQRRNVTTSGVGLKTVTYTKILPTMVNPTGITGNTEEEEGECSGFGHDLCFMESKSLPFLAWNSLYAQSKVLRMLSTTSSSFVLSFVLTRCFFK